MLKLLLIVGALVLLLWLIFGRRTTRESRGPTAPKRAEDMVACAHCGVHLPRSEAVLLGAQAYCSPAHRDAGQRTP